MNTDTWLLRWLPLIRSAAPSPLVLDLGCGPGWDASFLLEETDCNVTIADISVEAIDDCLKRLPKVRGRVHDLRDPLPFPDQSFDTVIASLCLHYFELDKTKEIVSEIHRCLRSGGYLLCRVNSTRDTNYGALLSAEPLGTTGDCYYQSDGVWKRFFDEACTRSLFGSNWRVISIEELSIERYDLPKVVWEAVVQKEPGDARTPS
jgi:SAM-dependent methyltransferase